MKDKMVITPYIKKGKVMKKKNIKLILLAVLASFVVAGCGTDDTTGTTADGKGKISDNILADKDSEDGTENNDKSETAGDEVETSEENSSVDKESTSSQQTSAQTQDNSSNENTDSQTASLKNTADNNGDSNNADTGSSNKQTASSNNGSSENTNKNTTGSNEQVSNDTPVKVETPNTAAVSVGNANSQISEQNKDIVSNNKTEYTGTSNNSTSKKIYVSENSVNYGYALAYVNGDTSRLDATQKQIFEVVKPLIDNVMANYSTDPEREKAIHDYIVSNCRYNIEACEDLSAMEDYNFHPEGVFLKKKAVCQGYAESFKLCMDLLGIRCDIVTGLGNGQAHAWNAVCLDNEWYQIDCTWDDPLIDVNGQQQDSGKVNYSYFNITDSQMKNDHVYTYENSCNGTKYSYDYFASGEYGTIYSTVSDYSNYVNSQLSAGKNDITAYVKCEGDVTIYSYLNENQIDLRKYPTERGLSMTCQASGISDTIYVINITVTVD